MSVAFTFGSSDAAHFAHKFDEGTNATRTRVVLLRLHFMNEHFSPADEALLQLARALRQQNYTFTTVTPATQERVNKRPENASAHDLAGVFGWSRAFRCEILTPHLWDLMQRADVIEPHGDKWKSRVRFSTLYDEIFVHSAFPTTGADAVFFGPDTVRFAAALQYFNGAEKRDVRRAVDIGCGAGPGAILTAKNFPDAEVLAVDINDRALRFTRLNAVLAQTPNVRALRSDLLSNVDGEFDLIVANPPYLVDASQRAYRHGGGPLGAGLSLAIFESALQRLAENGSLLLYTGVAMTDNCDPFRREIERLLPSNFRLAYRETDPDVFGEELETEAYAQCDRIAAVVLTLTRA